MSEIDYKIDYRIE